MSYKTVLKAHLALGRFTKAQALLREMAQRSLPANSVTYNESLSACVAAQYRRRMWGITDKMLAAGTAPNAAACFNLSEPKVHSHPFQCSADD